MDVLETLFDLEGKPAIATLAVSKETGSLASPDALAVAADVLDCFGVPCPALRFVCDPPEGAESGSAVLGTIVLLVARALGAPVARDRLIAVSWNPQQRTLEPAEPAPEASMLSLMSKRHVLVYDERPGPDTPSPAEVLREEAERRGVATTILGVSTLEHAMTALLGSSEWRRSIPRQDESVARAAEHLFRVTLRRRPNVLGNEAVVSIARAMLQGSPEGEALQWKLAFARDVARRHLGESVVPPNPPDVLRDAWDSGTRLAVMAHVVQGAADSDLNAVPYAIDEARETLAAEGDAAWEQAAELKGAIGRACAALGQYGNALAWLNEAAEAWRKHDRADRSSIAACEMLRVASLAMARSHQQAEWCMSSPGTDTVSRSYVVLARARADIVSGQLEQGLDRLSDSVLDWPHASPEVKPAALRWRHRAQVLLGRDSEARQSMQELERMEEGDQLHLARLDLALARGGDWQTPLADLFGVVPLGQEAVRTWRRLGGSLESRAGWTTEDARRLADEYRY